MRLGWLVGVVLGGGELVGGAVVGEAGGDPIGSGTEDCFDCGWFTIGHGEG